jgi:hypothetical protein
VSSVVDPSVVRRVRFSDTGKGRFGAENGLGRSGSKPGVF